MIIIDVACQIVILIIHILKVVVVILRDVINLKYLQEIIEHNIIKQLGLLLIDQYAENVLLPVRAVPITLMVLVNHVIIIKDII